ncbi:MULTISPECIES: hypothetical protein [Falsihalocynthiibacter]|jgi:hypothetical protein|uniref:hypothetical protein n=1 Tax=Falsihalocynthiibacter TaxID=2854182 RepID=UPI003002D0EE
MKLGRRILTLGVSAVLIAGTLELGAHFDVPGVKGIATQAEARIGRPLTPVSIAGVGRRTVRRCAVGVYNC